MILDLKWYLPCVFFSNLSKLVLCLLKLIKSGFAIHPVYIHLNKSNRYKIHVPLCILKYFRNGVICWSHFSPINIKSCSITSTERASFSFFHKISLVNFACNDSWWPVSYDCMPLQGYFQILYTCIEKLLAFLSVKLFVLPAADEAKSIWTNKFGFTTITEEQVH